MDARSALMLVAALALLGACRYTPPSLIEIDGIPYFDDGTPIDTLAARTCHGNSVRIIRQPDIVVEDDPYVVTFLIQVRFPADAPFGNPGRMDMSVEAGTYALIPLPYATESTIIATPTPDQAAGQVMLSWRVASGELPSTTPYILPGADDDFVDFAILQIIVDPVDTVSNITVTWRYVPDGHLWYEFPCAIQMGPMRL